MPISTLQKLASLRKLLNFKTDHEVLRLYLHQNQDNLLKEAVLVTIYRKWSSHPPHGLTEIGIATYDRQQVNCGLPCTPGPHAEDLLQHLWSMHLRIRSHAHLPSNNGDPTAFHFGTTVFVTQEEAMQMLHQIWHQPLNEFQLEGGLRPIICMSYSDNESLAKVRQPIFDFIPPTLGTTVKVLNAQNIAIQAKITSLASASIDYILPIFKITPFDADNGGNAATYSTIIALLSVLRDQIYGADINPRAKPGQKGMSAVKPAQSVIQWLMERPTPAPPFGTTTYCSRCGSYVHNTVNCSDADILCGRCSTSKMKWRQENAETHKEELCIYR
jgi:hypothetical protein